MKGVLAASGCGNETDTDPDHFSDPLFGGDEGFAPGEMVAASILCWMITSVAVAAGIGGGGLLVPMYFISLNLSQTRAVSLSKGTIFGVAIGNFFFISRERHPKVDRPLIDYPTAIFMQGGELMGVVLGVLFNLLLPELITILLSAVVLGFNSYKTLTKAVVKYKAETAKMLAAKDAEIAKSAEPAVDPTATPVTPGPPAESEPKKVEEVAVKVTGDPKLAAELLAEQSKAFPLWAWSILALMCSFFILYSLALGGTLDSEFTNCVPGYWPVYILPFVFYGCIIAYMAVRNMKMEEKIVASGIDRVKGDIQWNPRAVKLLTPAAIGAGVAAGLLGIGGGMILGPIFVALDFQPQVGTATTGFMILFTALGGTVKYLTIGKLSIFHLLWFGGLGICGGQTGQRVVKKIIQKTGRPSYVVFILGGIIGLAVIIMTSFGIKRVVEDDCGDMWAPDTDQFTCSEDDNRRLQEAFDTFFPMVPAARRLAEAVY